LITGDLGFSVIEPFCEEFPDRFINVGVAEQNMAGIGTGLALSGFIPFLYSISTFASMRPYEFLRNGPIHHHLPLRVIGVGTGFEYGSAGFTHHVLEDVGLFRLQPTMGIYSPADDAQTANVLSQTYADDGPTYYRLSKNQSAPIPGLRGKFEKGKIESLGDGDDVLLLALGSMCSEAIEAQTLLKTVGIHTRVGVVSDLRLSDHELCSLIKTCKSVLTIEAHYVRGGLATMVAETLSRTRISVPFACMGIEGTHDRNTGSLQWYNHRHALTAEGIASRASSLLGELR
jgi:transketolase